MRKSRGKEDEVGKYLEGLMFMSQIMLSYFAAFKLSGLFSSFSFFVLGIAGVFATVQSVWSVGWALPSLGTAKR